LAQAITRIPPLDPLHALSIWPSWSTSAVSLALLAGGLRGQLVYGMGKFNQLAARIRILEHRLALTSTSVVLPSFGDASYLDAQLHSYRLHADHNTLANWCYHFPTSAASAVRREIGDQAYRHARRVHRRAAALRHSPGRPVTRWCVKSSLDPAAAEFVPASAGSDYPASYSEVQDIVENDESVQDGREESPHERKVPERADLSLHELIAVAEEKMQNMLAAVMKMTAETLADRISHIQRDIIDYVDKGINRLRDDMLKTIKTRMKSNAPSFLEPVYKTIDDLRFDVDFIASLPGINILRARTKTSDGEWHPVPLARCARGASEVVLQTTPSVDVFDQVARSLRVPAFPAAFARLLYDTDITGASMEYSDFLCFCTDGDEEFWDCSGFVDDA